MVTATTEPPRGQGELTEHRIEREGKKRRLFLAGDLTAATVPELRTMLKSEFEQGAEEIVFDLRNTAMLDSSGIGLMIAAYNSLARKQGQVAVVNVSPDIQRLLQSMRLTERLHVTGPQSKEESHG